jgi:inhibitor of KinA sporulation pathway (predicted exonuclease)
MKNGFVFVDVETLFVPRDGILPLSELACLVVDVDMNFVTSFHRFLIPDRLPCTGEEMEKSEFVKTHITGLSVEMLHKFGQTTSHVRNDFMIFSRQYSHMTWVARDPSLEKRLFQEWDISHVVVHEVLDFVRPDMYGTLFRKTQRPQTLRQMADMHSCACHAGFHCAMADVVEEYLWVWYFA